MTIYLVRHAKAGRRGEFDGPDWLRPLVANGQAQARCLLDQMKRAKFGAILSSPYVRCMETVVPLASDHRLSVIPVDPLAEGAPLDDILDLLREYSVDGAVMCSHGDVIPMVLEYLQHRGTNLGPDPRCEKGSTWIIEGDVDGVATARYVAPPIFERS